MALESYSELQEEIIGNSNRSDLAASIPTFIRLAEADMKRRLKLVELEGTESISVAGGVGSLPADYAMPLSVYWDAAEDAPLRFLDDAQFNVKRSLLLDGSPVYYTITGTTVRVLPADTGTLVLNYVARLSPLSDESDTNTILTNYPDAYYYGALAHLYHYARNWEAKAANREEFERAIDQIIRDADERKYPSPLSMRAQ
jgi:hypothetical protein